MQVWNIPTPTQPVRIMVMAMWGGECYDPRGRLVLSRQRAAYVMGRNGGDTSCVLPILIRDIERALSHGSGTTTNTPTTGLAA